MKNITLKNLVENIKYFKRCQRCVKNKCELKTLNK